MPNTISLHEAVQQLSAHDRKSRTNKIVDFLTTGLTFKDFADFVQDLGPEDVLLEKHGPVSDMDLSMMNIKLCDHIIECLKLAADYDLPVADYLTAKAERESKRKNKASHE